MFEAIPYILLAVGVTLLAVTVGWMATIGTMLIVASVVVVFSKRVT